MAEQFDKVFYIFQTKPRLRICGYTFNKNDAKHIARYVKQKTRSRSKIVEFTRDELVGLGYDR